MWEERPVNLVTLKCNPKSKYQTYWDNVGKLRMWIWINKYGLCVSVISWEKVG